MKTKYNFHRPFSIFYMKLDDDENGDDTLSPKKTLLPEPFKFSSLGKMN